MSMKNKILLETVADIAYYAGQKQFYSGDSRLDMSEFIRWAKEFEKLNKCTNWGKLDYMIAVEEYTQKRIDSSIL